jgi:membrane protease YdiL (CAAX protease family)
MGLCYDGDMAMDFEISVKTSWRSRALALIEVCAVFGLAHLTYRAFKHFTYLGEQEETSGLNYSAGAVLILFSLAAMLLHKSSLPDYGLKLTDWPQNLATGLIAGLLLAIGAALMLAVRLVPPTAFQRPDLPTALVASAGYIVVTLFVLLALRRDGRLASRWLLAGCVVLLAAIWATPVVAAKVLHRDPLRALASLGWLVICAGFGEEVFFRGYVQSRINRVFGRPVRLLGVSCGLGLLVSALLFGVIHILNTVDYFTGCYEFAWGSGLMNVAAGMFLGLLRERTGSIVAGGVAHGLVDVLAEVPRLLNGQP